MFQFIELYGDLCVCDWLILFVPTTQMINQYKVLDDEQSFIGLSS
jgi:hypothetical protein